MKFGVRLLAARSRTKIGLALGCSLVLSTLNVASQNLPNAPATRANALSNPFAASSKSELPPLPKISGLPSLPPVALPQRLPADLRALLISESGTGLLGTSKEDAASIWVTHGKSTRIGEQEVFVEVGKTSIRLYSASKGKLLWEGRLRGPESTTLPADMSQKRYIPPLSAGVNPGLGQTRSTLPDASISRVTAIGGQ
jgi:hypothetical protein